MNALTATETTALATMSPASRAALAMKTTSAELALRDLLKASASILVVTSKAGREECHAAYMKLKNSVTDIGKIEVAVTEDAKAFTKAVKVEAARLAGIIIAERDRLQVLRDGFDAIEEARKANELAKEMARIAAIQARIQFIRDLALKAVGANSAGIEVLLVELQANMVDDTYAEMADMANTAWDGADHALNTALETALAAEAAEAQRLADIAAADRRRADEAAENARVAAENQRIAAENAAAAQKLADQQAVLDLAARQQREQAEASARAEDARRAEAARIEQVERDRAAAEAQAVLEVERAEIAAARQALADEQAAAAKERADTAALGMAIYFSAMPDAEFDALVGGRDLSSAEQAAYEAEGAARYARFHGHGRVKPEAADKFMEAVAAPSALLDAADELDPTNEEIKDMGRECGLALDAWADRLELFVAWARAEKMAVVA
ncbi:hypothetical protein ACQ4WP_29100 [Janthinobacterium sp. GB4P2]|uniref:hypothetical protein n=1 Tax=Janthinobacterium sp. GB4P2 TaxID=3424189 RepID=UPI003F28F777